jgi:hypothetical protein
LAIVFVVSPAFADSSVLLVVKGAPDQDTAPYELRLRSEFAAEGLEVVTASGRSQQNILDLEGLARRTGAVAAISVYIDAQDVQGRLWVSDPNSNADLVRTLRVSRIEGDSVSVFALRAVEALRGARLELEQQRRRTVASETSGDPVAVVPPVATSASEPSAKPVSAPPRQNPKLETPKSQPKIETEAHDVDAKPASAQRTYSWAVVLGGAFGSDQNGLGLMGSPFLDLRYRAWELLSFGVSLEGPFPRRLPSDAGTVQFDQEILELQARLKLATYGRLTFEGLVTTGPSRFAVASAETTVLGQPASDATLAWVVGAGAGTQLALTGHWILGLDAEGMQRLPAPVTHAGEHRLTGNKDLILLGKLGIGVLF